ncbi:hypothetical protein BDZ85DRAFT_270212 [Elsinoe ampelina]|uniref:Uncharacterized protein n=1 Tax=Elsinoe ampelina TaxID=302913 RepID=A0A6A6FYQ2_9PEZI|nr:hypothetical protein BDZ85DRAFT_270212 [Elsinoe ampelina]
MRGHWGLRRCRICLGPWTLSRTDAWMVFDGPSSSEEGSNDLLTSRFRLRAAWTSEKLQSVPMGISPASSEG